MASIAPLFLSRSARGVVLAVASLAFLAGCGGQSQPRQMPPTPVGVMVTQAQPIPLVRDATGRLSAFRSADVRARTSGVLLKRTYDEGTHVDKGQQLFLIDPAPLKASLSAAEANLAQAQATYVNAKVAAKRAHKLAPKGYVSQADLDDAEAKQRTAKAAVQAASAQVESARIKLGYAKVSSPIAGRAGKQQVTEGALVGQNDATLLTTVRQIDPMYVNFSLPVSEMQQLRAAQASGSATLSGGQQTSVQLSLSDGSRYAHDGKLDFTGMSVDPSTGSITLRAIVPNPEQLLLPGMYTALKVHLGSLNHAFLIPQNALLRDAASAYVLVVGEGNKVERKNVHTDGMRGSDWIVDHGLSAGEHVIVSGVAKARAGSVVKPHIQGAAPATPPAHAASSSKPQTKAHKA